MRRYRQTQYGQQQGSLRDNLAFKRGKEQNGSKNPAQESTPITKTMKKQYRAEKTNKLQDHIKLLMKRK